MMAPYVCPKCDREFGSPAALGSHRRIHAPDWTFTNSQTVPVPMAKTGADSARDVGEAPVDEFVTDEEAAALTFDPLAETVARPVAVVVSLPANVTQVLVRGVAAVAGEVIEIDVKTLANDRVWAPLDLRGGTFRVEDAS